MSKLSQTSSAAAAVEVDARPDEAVVGSVSPIDAGNERPLVANGQEQIIGLLSVQNEILDEMAKGADLTEILAQIQDSLQSLIPEACCALVLFNDQLDGIECVLATENGGFEERLGTIRVSELPETGRDGPDEVPRISLIGQDAAQQCTDFRGIAVSQGLYPGWLEPIRGGDEKPLGIIAVCFRQERELSVTEQRVVRAMTQLVRFAVEFERHSLALQSANDRFASLASTIPGVVYQRIVTPDGRMYYSFISEGARELFGVSSDEILADPNALFSRHGPDYAATFRERLLKASRDLTMWDVEASIITSSGQKKYTHAIARPTRRPDGAVQWDGVILDATRIKEAELATAAAEARTRDTIVDSIPDGFVLFGPDDRLVTFNSRFLEFFPELMTAVTGDFTYQELAEAVTAAGLDLDKSTRQSDDDQLPGEPAESDRQERRVAARSVERRLAGGRWILVNEKRTADGSTVMLLTDVTELKDREVALERSNRELQDFASVASHDLQEPLRKIEAFGDRLKARFKDQLGEDGGMYIDRMQNATVRMRSLINDLLSYSRVTTKAMPFKEVSLETCVREVMSDLQVAIESTDAEIELASLPVIEADPLQMRMLMQNLLSNAIKFHAKDVCPKISISAEVHSSHFGCREGEGSVDQVCEIRVRDNGIGFDAKYLDRIFSIFQRLHGRNEYEGTGIGLATCRKIVERHGGVITAESAPGKGTTFIVTLPVKQTSPGVQT